MAILKLDKNKLKHNFDYLNELFLQNDIDWAIVTKILCGNALFLNEVLGLGIKEVCDSRLKNLELIKKLNPKIQTVYIKPPPQKSIKRVVQYADVSFNTESSTIELLSKEAVRQGKIHRITIMIELGDLREGIMGENLLNFYEKIFKLPNIEVVAIGTNLNCLNGVMPSHDKLLQLALYSQIIELKFNKKIKWITGGTSVVIPLILEKSLPKAINHFRVGEALFFGNNLVTEKPYENLYQDVFKLCCEIIAITHKPKTPIGQFAKNPSGEEFEIIEEDLGQYSFRAILDLGLLDININNIAPEDENIKLISASSDMLVIDLGVNPHKYQVGDSVTFCINYMGALSLLSSDYIDKEII